MSRIFSTQRLGELFGLFQGLMLGGITLGAVIFALIVHLLLPFLPGDIPITMQNLAYLGIALLVVEFIIYWLTASSLTQGDIPSTAAGVGMVLIVRMIIVLVIYLVLNDAKNVEHELLLANLIQLFMIATGLLVLLYPFRRLLESHFGSVPQKKRTSPQKKRPLPVRQPQGNFAFRSSEKAPVKPLQTIWRAMPPVPGAVALTPPDYFVRQGVAHDVNGTIVIPRDVIVDSLPEAAELLTSIQQFRVQMAYFVPQLAYPSAWFTWEQFVEGIDKRSLPNTDIDFQQANLHGRWIRIPARVFVLQIPREYFDRTPVSRPWMKLPPVPQESLFEKAVAAGEEE